MKIKFTDRASGQDLDMDHRGGPLKIPPLNFDALRKVLKNHSTRTKIYVGEVNAHKAIDLPEKNLELIVDIDWEQPVRIFTLTVGGWLPPLYSNVTVLLPDRNILSHLDRPSSEPQGWHSRIVNETAQSGTVVDPLICALEGRNKRSPSLIEFRAELERGRRKFEKYWPDIHVYKRTVKKSNALYTGLLSWQILAKNNTLNFLIACQKILPNKPASHKKKSITDEVFKLAYRHRVDTRRFAFATVLALIYANETQPAFASQVLKFYTKNYVKELAYNALSDISSLELLLLLNSCLDEKIGLLTGDQGLALLWSAMTPEPLTRTKTGGYSLQFMPSEKLLPSLSEKERSDLKERCTHSSNGVWGLN